MSEGIDYRELEALHFELGGVDDYGNQLTIAGTHGGTTSVSAASWWPPERRTAIISISPLPEKPRAVMSCRRTRARGLPFPRAFRSRVSQADLQWLGWRRRADNPPTGRRFRGPAGGITFNGGTQRNTGNALTSIDPALRGMCCGSSGPAAGSPDRHPPVRAGGDGRQSRPDHDRGSRPQRWLGNHHLHRSGTRPGRHAGRRSRVRLYDCGEAITLGAPGNAGEPNWIGSELAEKTSSTIRPTR